MFCCFLCQVVSIGQTYTQFYLTYVLLFSEVGYVTYVMVNLYIKTTTSTTPTRSFTDFIENGII